MTVNISKGINNKFQLIFPKFPLEDDLTSQKQFSLNLVNGIVPSMTLNRIEMPYRGGQTWIENGFESFGDWTTEILIDSNFLSWKAIYNWMSGIANNQDVFGFEDQSYSIDAILYVLDNFNNDILKFQFTNVWPYNLGEVNYTYEDGRTVLKCDVSFSYDQYFIIEPISFN